MRTLDWDSTFFNLKIGETDVDSFDVNNISSFDLVYIKSLIDFTLNIENYTNSYSELKITYSKELKISSSECNFIIDVRKANFNINTLYNLAYESGKYSRFRLDIKFSKIQFKKLYRTWIDNSLVFSFADIFDVYIEDNIILGFITCKISGNDAKIGLLSVDKNSQGKGIGTKLLKCIENKLYNQNIKNLYIPTQEINFQACNFYKKNGYSIDNKIYIKHFWKNDTI